MRTSPGELRARPWRYGPDCIATVCLPTTCGIGDCARCRLWWWPIERSPRARSDVDHRGRRTGEHAAELCDGVGKYWCCPQRSTRSLAGYRGTRRASRCCRVPSRGLQRGRHRVIPPRTLRAHPPWRHGRVTVVARSDIVGSAVATLLGTCTAGGAVVGLLLPVVRSLGFEPLCEVTVRPPNKPSIARADLSAEKQTIVTVTWESITH